MNHNTVALLLVGWLACSSSGPEVAPEMGAPDSPVNELKCGPGQTDSACQSGIGAVGPVIIEDTADDGSWVLMCQARADTDGNGKIALQAKRHGRIAGDRLDTYLVVGSGPGELIEDVVATDSGSGRLVVQRNGTLLLLRPSDGTEVNLSELGADGTDDDSPLMAHRSASFDGSGKYLVYLSEVRAQPRVVVRDLARGRDTAIEPGPGKLWRVQLDRSGQWVSIWVIAEDTNDDGQLTWPQGRTTLAGRRCRGPVRSYGIRGRTGDRPLRRVARVGSGQAAIEVPGFIGFFGDHLLVRKAGAIVLDDGAGQQVELVPAACGGYVAALDVARKRVMAACTNAKPVEYRLYELGAPPRAFGQAGEYWSMDERVLRDMNKPIGRHWFAAGEGTSTVIIDTETGVRRTITDRQKVLVERGANTLVNREGRLILMSGATEREVVDLKDEYPDVHTTGRFAVINEYVLDVEAGELLGTVTGVPLAITAAGQVLRAPPLAPRAPPPPDAGFLYEEPSRFPQGPLRWVEPTP